VAHHGKGGLIGAAYAEVPYVDVLRTTTNPLLPLTVLEYEEFGNPAEKLEDLETILRLSPVDALPEEGAPRVFVVARTSLNDREVLPYESMKWITRLRGFPTPTVGAEEKYLFIGNGQGHFVRGINGDKEKAEDFLLLNSWLARVKS
jgi:oligopeptidase B